MVSNDHYQTIESSSTAEYKEKGSRFLAFAFPVEQESQIKELIQEFRKKYYDARHICYGYILGNETKVMKGNDDGEPAHTAGTPILNQIRSRNLTNIVILVVRYFGGTKLGVSGLIEAYKEATKSCLDHAIIIDKYVTIKIQLEFQAHLQGEVMRLIKEYGADIQSIDYENSTIIIIQVRKSLVNYFIEKQLQGVTKKILD
jgi:uncharacterized YigZ family protein